MAYLGTRAGQIRTEHDDPRSGVAKLLVGERSLLQELDVSTTAVADLLELGLVLKDERLALGVKWGSQRCGDGVVSSFGFSDETLVALDGREDGRLLDGPLADVREGLATNGRLFGGLRGSPS